MKLKLKHLFLILIPVFFVNFLILVLAWNPPTEPPPGGNPPAFLSVSDVTQFKEGALGIGGVLQAFVLQLYPDGASKPTCNSNTRGMFWFEEGGEEEADEILACQKDVLGAFSWEGVGSGGVEWIETTYTPPAPTVVEVGPDYIVLDDTDCPGKALFKKDDGDWQFSSRFTDIDPSSVSYDFKQFCGAVVGVDPVSEEHGYLNPSNISSVTSSTTCNDYAVGQKCGGGIVAYHDGDGGGLIAATSDQSDDIQWGCRGTEMGGTSTDYGTGKDNTDAIIAWHEGWSSPWETGPNGETCNSGNDGTVAALVARNYDRGGYNDWFLPSKDELDILFQNREAIGNFDISGDQYWSSSENGSTSSWVQRFSDGNQYYTS